MAGGSGGLGVARWPMRRDPEGFGIGQTSVVLLIEIENSLNDREHWYGKPTASCNILLKFIEVY